MVLCWTCDKLRDCKKWKECKVYSCDRFIQLADVETSDEDTNLYYSGTSLSRKLKENKRYIERLERRYKNEIEEISEFLKNEKGVIVGRKRIGAYYYYYIKQILRKDEII